jgi:uroporphyrinogen-III synthase
MAADSGALAGLGVLVTRPAHQAESLCALIEQQGGRAYRFPVLEILDPLDPGPLQAVATQLDAYDWAIFVSVNAVDRALDSILAVRDWPADTRIAVIGRSSAQALQRHGLDADLYPEHQFDSEALLALPAMQRVKGQRVVIFRGDGGREYLAETLRQGGAQVDYIEAYRRARPAVEPAALLAQWQRGSIDIVVVTSAESLKNLDAMIGEAGSELLRRTQLLLVSERQIPLAQHMGFELQPLIADNATDASVVQALQKWRKAQKH